MKGPTKTHRNHSIFLGGCEHKPIGSMRLVHLPVLIHLFGCRFTSRIWRLSLSYIIKRNRSETWNLPWFSTISYHGKSNIQELIIGVYNHLLSKVFRFHYHSQKVIGSLGLLRNLWILGLYHFPFPHSFCWSAWLGADILNDCDSQ